MFPNNVDVYILHVNDRKYEDRKQHIEETMKKHNIPFKWMLDGDIKHINDDILSMLFSPNFTTTATPAASCCYKHFLIWNTFLNSDKEYCLVLEDDVFLDKDFIPLFKKSLSEATHHGHKYSIQYSNSANQYTAQAQLQEGQHLYPNKGCRATDAYLITKEVAKLRCDYIEKHKFTHPADWQTNIMDNALGIQFLWFEPTIVEQGTQSGKFQSIIQESNKPLWLRRIQWQIKKFFRSRK